MEIFFDDETAIDVTDDLDYVGMYSKLLNFEDPIIEKNVEGNYIVFDGKGTLTEDMLNYFFSYTEFYINEENKLSTIRIHNELIVTEKLGDYFYIPVEQAREKLYKGEFYTNSGYGIYENCFC